MTRITLIMFSLALSTLTSCATFRGAPPAPFVVKDVWSKKSIQVAVQSLSGNCSTDSSGAGREGNPRCIVVSSDTDRNKMAHLLLALVDTEYSDFTQKFVYEKQHVQASTNFLRLLMTTAGGLTKSLGKV
jgi:hypothetical protein